MVPLINLEKVINRHIVGLTSVINKVKDVIVTEK